MFRSSRRTRPYPEDLTLWFVLYAEESGVYVDHNDLVSLDEEGILAAGYKEGEMLVWVSCLDLQTSITVRVAQANPLTDSVGVIVGTTANG